MGDLSKITDKIKSLKDAREILNSEYSKSDFHKRKEAHPHEIVPPSPKDEEIYKLLIAIQQLDFYIKRYQDEHFELLKKQDSKKV